VQVEPAAMAAAAQPLMDWLVIVYWNIGYK
jgi:hypothetical protein